MDPALRPKRTSPKIAARDRAAPLPLEPKRPRGRPRAEDAEHLQARLIKVGRAALFKYGYGAKIMDRVATAARVSKGTLYSRFKNKEELLLAVIADQIGEWDHGSKHRPVSFGETLEDTLFDYGVTWLSAGQSAEFVGMSRLLASASGQHPAVAKAADQLRIVGIELLQQTIEHFAQKDGIPCRDSHLAAEIFHTTLTGWNAGAIAADRAGDLQSGLAWLRKYVVVFVASRSAW